MLCFFDQRTEIIDLSTIDEWNSWKKHLKLKTEIYTWIIPKLKSMQLFIVKMFNKILETEIMDMMQPMK